MPETPLISPTRRDIYPFISPHRDLIDAAKDRNILITGAGSGIGKTTAEIFAQASAASVVLVGRNIEKLEKVQHDLVSKYPACNILAESCDVSSEPSVDVLFQRLEDQNVEIDVLINNAGVAAQYTSIQDSDPTTWWHNHEIMLKGPYLTSRAFLRHRTSGNSKPGAILNTSTIGSYRLEPNMSSYCIPKTALNRLTEYIAAECQSSTNSNISSVHCIAFHPGGIAETELTAGAPDWLVPLLSESAELAGGVTLWLSTERAKWLSGRYVDARWDLEVLEGLRGLVEEGDGLKGGLVGCVDYRDR